MTNQNHRSKLLSRETYAKHGTSVTSRNSRLKLLPREALIKTGTVDHADWNFKPILGWIQRLRFKLILSLLPSQLVGRLLEVGYGSGIFMPTLVDRCSELYGIDIHPCNQAVTERLQAFQIKANLFAGTSEVLPFESHFFDVVVAISTLEFVEDVEAACREVRRVLKPNGCLILVTPGHSPLLDLGLKLLTGESAKKDYENRRQSLMPALKRHFQMQEERTFPAIGSSILCLYKAMKLTP